jgi:hypothetical protein
MVKLFFSGKSLLDRIKLKSSLHCRGMLKRFEALTTKIFRMFDRKRKSLSTFPHSTHYDLEETVMLHETFLSLAYVQTVVEHLLSVSICHPKQKYSNHYQSSIWDPCWRILFHAHPAFRKIHIFEVPSFENSSTKWPRRRHNTSRLFCNKCMVEDLIILETHTTTSFWVTHSPNLPNALSFDHQRLPTRNKTRLVWVGGISKVILASM